MQKTALVVSGVIFLVVSILHFLRAFEGIAVSVGQTPIPLSISWIGGAVSFLLAVWMVTASKK